MNYIRDKSENGESQKEKVATDNNKTEIEHEEQKHIMMDTTPDDPKTIDKELLMKMIHHYFELAPKCMFIVNQDNGGIAVNNIQYFQFVTGPTQLLTGYHFGCLPSRLGFNRAFMWGMGKDDEIRFGHSLYTLFYRGIIVFFRCTHNAKQ